jgi:hypothetical protein
MASEKQIAANRANAKRSTGPKTLAGKTASSRNAFRHGLSGPLRLDPVIADKVDAIAQALAGEETEIGYRQLRISRGLNLGCCRSAQHAPS